MTPLTTWLVLGAVAAVIAYALKQAGDNLRDRTTVAVAATDFDRHAQQAIAVANNPALGELTIAAEVETWLKNGGR